MDSRQTANVVNNASKSMNQSHRAKHLAGESKWVSQLPEESVRTESFISGQSKIFSTPQSHKIISKLTLCKTNKQKKNQNLLKHDLKYF